MNNNQSEQYAHRYRPIKLDKKGKVEEPKAVKVPSAARQAIAKGFGKFIAGIKAVPSFVTNTVPNFVADKITDAAYASRANRIDNIDRQISAIDNTIDQNINLINQFNKTPEDRSSEDHRDIADVKDYISELVVKAENLENKKLKLKKGSFWFSGFFGHKEDNIPAPENENTQAEVAEQKPVVEPVKSVEPFVVPNIPAQKPVVPSTEQPKPTIKNPELEELDIEKVIKAVTDLQKVKDENNRLTLDNNSLKGQVSILGNTNDGLTKRNEELTVKNKELENNNKDLAEKNSTLTATNSNQVTTIANLKQELDKAKESARRVFELQDIINGHERTITDMKNELDKFKLEADVVAKTKEDLARVTAERNKYFEQLVQIAKAVRRPTPEQAETSRTI